MEAMCQAQIAAGMDEVAVTEHLDVHPLDSCPGFYRPNVYFAELARCRERFDGQLTIRAGIELGDGHRFADALGAVVDAWPFDFAIGSVHFIDDEAPFGRPFYRQRDAAFAFGGYFREALALARAGDFDVLGHLDMPKREGTDYYGAFDPVPYGDEIRAVLRALIERGKGIEINTSGWRRSCDEPCPGPIVLGWYAELGGEVLTIGSDAHRVAHVALRHADAVALARESGLRWLTTFERRQAIQHRL
jgi:histidinol-phosphatase (PHP family)